MSLALDFLTDYFAQPDVTKAEFAKAAGVDPSLVTALMNGDVLIGGKNVPKLLRGFRSEDSRREFLLAYLRDQVPVDYADDISVHMNSTAGGEDSPEDSKAQLEMNLVSAFNSLPNDSYRRRLVQFMRHLRKDDALRDLFNRTMRYLDDGFSGRSSIPNLVKQESAALKDEEAKGSGKGKKKHGTTV